MSVIKTAYGQSLIDLAIQYHGSAEGVFSIIADNPNKGLGVDTEIEAGTELRISTTPIEKGVVQHMENNGLVPATWADGQQARQVGIGAMVTGLTFIIR